MALVDKSTSAPFTGPVILARIILGLLDLAPMTGYELKRHFDTTVQHFWSADKAQIYRTLSQLSADGLVTVETVPGVGGPDRQVHHVTDRGRQTLAAWLASGPDHQPERDPFLARLFFAGRLAESQLADLLAERRRSAKALLAAL